MTSKDRDDRTLSPEEKRLRELVEEITPKKSLEPGRVDMCKCVLEHLPEEERSRVVRAFRDRAKQLGIGYMRLFVAFLEDLAEQFGFALGYLVHAINQAGSFFGFLKEKKIIASA